MFFLPVFRFLLILFCITNALSYRYDYNYTEAAGGGLKFHQMPTTWNDARLICHAEGAVLLSPTDENIQAEMVRIMELQNASCGVFTGIHASFAKGIFSSLQGVPLSKMALQWAPNEPDNYENSEGCLIMLSNGTMADVNCGEVFPFICYRKMSGTGTKSICGSGSDGYSWELYSNSCYKFHSVGQTWSNAFMTCDSEGGHLAIINSETEAVSLTLLISKFPTNKIFSKYTDAFIGFVDWNKNGEWFTINGDNLQEAGYSTWDEGQPNNLTKNNIGQHCGTMTRDGKLNDIWCNEIMAFICEKRVLRSLFPVNNAE